MAWKKYSYKIIAIILVGWMVSCSAGIPVQFPRFPSGPNGERLKSVMSGKRRIAVVARDLSASISAQMSGSSLAGEWQETTRGTVKKAFQEKGYYEIVDLDSRDLRYQELAHAQTGMTQNQLKIGQELAINGLLFVQMTAKPRSECKREEVSQLTAQAMQLAMMAASKGRASEAPKQYAGVTYVTAFVQGTLVNVETGASVSYTSTAPYRLENDAGNLQCPSELTAFDGALSLAAEAIAENLSPEIVTLKIPLADDTDGLAGNNTDRVEAFLDEGIKWAEAGDFQQAAQSWQRALDESGGRSSAALWNLAAYSWYAGEMDMAEDYFSQSMRTAEPGWMTSGKRFIFTKFKEEKERKLREAN